METNRKVSKLGLFDGTTPSDYVKVFNSYSDDEKPEFDLVSLFIRAGNSTAHITLTPDTARQVAAEILRRCDENKSGE